VRALGAALVTVVASGALPDYGAFIGEVIGYTDVHGEYYLTWIETGALLRGRTFRYTGTALVTAGEVSGTFDFAQRLFEFRAYFWQKLTFCKLEKKFVG
jgi:hypothetical protein